MEFKESAVKLVTEQGYTVDKAAKSLGVDRTSIPVGSRSSAPGREYRRRADLRKANDRLRAENKRLIMEREILKKATAFFAKEQS